MTKKATAPTVASPTFEKGRKGRPTAEMSERLQTHILDSAWQVFTANGFGNATVLQICAQAGISQATFYRHFTGKDDIFTVAMRRMTEMEMAILLKIESADLEDGLLQFAEAHLESLPATHAEGAMRLIYAEAPRFPELARQAVESTLEWLKILMAFFQRHRPDLPNAEAFDLAVLFMGMVGGRYEHEVLLCVNTFDSARKKRHAKLAVQIFLHGFAR